MLSNMPFKGTFYEEEVQRVMNSDEYYNVEKVMKNRKIKRRLNLCKMVTLVTKLRSGMPVTVITDNYKYKVA